MRVCFTWFDCKLNRAVYVIEAAILVNNAGRSQRAWPEKTSLEVNRALLDLNVVGTISLTKAVLPHMIERHEGQIVVLSSILGKIDNAKWQSVCFYY